MTEDNSQADLYKSSPLFRHVWTCPLGWMDGKLLWHKGTTEKEVIGWLQELRRLAGIVD